MPKIIIDDIEYEVGENRNCLEVALENGLDIPYFCYHPALSSVGACRLCAVKLFKDGNDRNGRITMSCMTPAQEGTRFSINDKEAVQFREWIIELLMINHPHDCPICDEGGECHLQDMVVMVGHNKRRYRGKKRTHRNQYLGPFINHEMNRCIQCYRCTRYYQECAGGHDLAPMAQRDRVYFGRHEDGILESPFAGNLVDICPTGVFTDKTSRKHSTRKWDLESAPSICNQCSVGCHTLPGARYGALRRISPRYNEAVNGYFICDRGRFGYEYNNASSRLKEPFLENGKGFQAIDRQSAWEKLQDFCTTGHKIAGIGSPRASIESNYALRNLVGPEDFSNGLSANEHQLVQTGLEVYQKSGVSTPTLTDIEGSDVILILGCDVTHEIPRVDLAIRQAVKRGAKLLNARLRGTALDEVADAQSSFTPPDLFDFTQQCIGALEKKTKAKKEDFLKQVVSAVQEAKRPLIIAGTYHGMSSLWHIAGQLAASLKNKGASPRILFAFPEANSVGVGLLGGESVDTLFDRIEAGEIQRLIVVENDLFERHANFQRLVQILKKLDRLIVLDHSETETVARADLFIPVATVAESNGLWVNAEGRAARAFEVYRPENWVPPSWMVLSNLSDHKGNVPSETWVTPDAIIVSLAKENPIFGPAQRVSPPESFRVKGQKIPRQSPRASGRMALPVWKDVRQHAKPPEDTQTPFSFSMEGNTAGIPSDLIPRFWAPNWNSQEAINKYQIEVGKGLYSGASGVRLIEPNGAGGGWRASEQREREGEAPSGSARGGGDASPYDVRTHRQLLIVPVAEIFGSERFSRLSPAIAELIPTPYLEVHSKTAKKLKLESGQTRHLSWEGQRASLQVCINDTLPEGVGATPALFPETGYLKKPVVATLDGGVS